MHLITNIKLKCALFEVHMVLVRDQLEHEFSFRCKSIVRGHYVYKGALNKKYFDNRIKPAPNSEYALISEVRLTMREYGILCIMHYCHPLQASGLSAVVLGVISWTTPSWCPSWDKQRECCLKLVMCVVMFS